MRKLFNFSKHFYVDSKDKVFQSLARILSIAVVILMITLCFFAPKVYAGEKLIFDEDGNLIFSAINGKDTTGVAFRTIGWVLKRYDLPIDSPYQQYIIVPKKSSESYYPNPFDRSIIVSVFKSDSREILSSIERVSKEWKEQLVNYGGTVYIDSVMTVVQYGKIMGQVADDGRLSGETYVTYKGIAAARPWGNPRELMQYYDIKVDYKAKQKVQGVKCVINTTQNMNYNSIIAMNGEIGSNHKGQEIYDVAAGIPSGERVYFCDNVSKYYYDLDLSKVYADITIDVPVKTTYILRWVGTDGSLREEYRDVTRYYPVTRRYSYYEIKRADVYALNSIMLESAALESESNLFNGSGITSNVSKSLIHYSAIEDRIKGMYITTPINSGTVVIDSHSIIKPSIPNTDYKYLAEQKYTTKGIRSDSLIIDGKTILSNDVNGTVNGKAPTYIVPDQLSVYKTGLNISNNRENGLYSAKYTASYKNISNQNCVKKDKILRNILIHTPIVCKISILCTKTHNQEVKPVDNTAVLGREFSISVDYSGKHSEKKGYGVKNYSVYAGKKYIVMPVDVYYENQLYFAGEMIDVSGKSRELTGFKIPEYVAIGDYEVKYICYIRNAKGTEIKGAEFANVNYDEVFAYTTMMMHITGAMFDLTVNGSESVDKLLYESGDNNETQNITMKIVGDYKEDDYLVVDCRYKYLKDGEITYANIYRYKNGEVEKLPSQITVMSEDFDEIDKGINSASFEFDMSGDIYAFPEEVNIATAKDVLKNYGQILKKGQIIVSFNPYVIREGEPFISYINEKNAKNGYCNMWKLEGFHYRQNLNKEAVTLADGDAIYYFGKKRAFFDYKVVGTH